MGSSYHAERFNSSGPGYHYSDRRTGLGAHRTMMSTGLDGSGSEANPPRKRIAVACGRCRKRKIRCSGDPGNRGACENCKSAGAEHCLFLRVASTEATLRHDDTTYTYNIPMNRAPKTMAATFAGQQNLMNPPHLPTSHPDVLTSASSVSSQHGTPTPGAQPGSPGGGYMSAGGPTSTAMEYGRYGIKYNSGPTSHWMGAYGDDQGSIDYNSLAYTPYAPTSHGVSACRIDSKVSTPGMYVDMEPTAGYAYGFPPSAIQRSSMQPSYSSNSPYSSPAPCPAPMLLTSNPDRPHRTPPHQAPPYATSSPSHVAMYRGLSHSQSHGDLSSSHGPAPLQPPVSHADVGLDYRSNQGSPIPGLVDAPSGYVPYDMAVPGFPQHGPLSSSVSSGPATSIPTMASMPNLQSHAASQMAAGPSPIYPTSAPMNQPSLVRASVQDSHHSHSHSYSHEHHTAAATNSQAPLDIKPLVSDTANLYSPENSLHSSSSCTDLDYRYTESRRDDGGPVSGSGLATSSLLSNGSASAGTGIGGSGDGYDADRAPKSMAQYPPVHPPFSGSAEDQEHGLGLGMPIPGATRTKGRTDAGVSQSISL